MVMVMVVVGKRRTVQGAAGSDCGDQATPARSERRQTAIRIEICHNRMLCWAGAGTETIIQLYNVWDLGCNPANTL